MNDSILPQSTVMQGFTFPANASSPPALNDTSSHSLSIIQPQLLNNEKSIRQPESASSGTNSTSTGRLERSSALTQANHLDHQAIPGYIRLSATGTEDVESGPTVQRHTGQDSCLLAPFTQSTPPSALDLPNTSPSERDVTSYSHPIKQDSSPTTPTHETILLTTTSPTRNPFSRRRSSQKPTLNLIIEDPSPPLSVSATIASCAKDDDVSPFEQGSMRVELGDEGRLGSDGRRLRQLGGKVARRAYSMNDLGRHEHEYKTATEETAVQRSAVRDTDLREEEDYVTRSSGSQDSIGPEQPVHVDDAQEGKGDVGQAENQIQQDVRLEDTWPTETPSKHGTNDSTVLTPKGKLEPRTITVADASSASLALILDPPTRHGAIMGTIEPQNPVAYNNRLPHPAILYAALGGKDVDLSEYFDENGVFVDMMYRRVGDGGNKVLLQDGEAVTFPTVKDTASHDRSSQASSTSKDIGTTTTSDPAMGHDGILWKDDHVFGKSTTSGMTWAEANSQLQLLREIHVTAQQMVTGDDQLFQQATDLIHNVTSLVRLTESAYSRQTPSWAYNSVSEYDSAHGGREQKKRSKKTSRRADHTKDRNATRTLPRHLQSRSSGSQMPYTWSSVPSGCPPMHANNYAFGSPSSAAPVTYPYSTGYQQPYYAAQTENHPAHDMSSVAPGGMWPAPASVYVTAAAESPISPSYSPSVSLPLSYKSDICRTYWINGDCPYRLRCYFVHPPPSAHQTVARDTIAALEDPVAGIHMQKYQDQHNVQNLLNILRAGVDSISEADAVSQPTIVDLLSQAQAGSHASSYAVMPLLNGSMVPFYPLQPAVSATVTSTSQGHFIRLPPPPALQHSEGLFALPPHHPAQLITKEDIATHLQAGKAKNRVPPANRQRKETSARRFSTAGPLPRKSTDAQATFASKARAAQEGTTTKAVTMNRPASRTLKQVRQTTLQENSRLGTRLEPASQGTGSLQVVNAINQVESRLSNRQH